MSIYEKLMPSLVSLGLIVFATNNVQAQCGGGASSCGSHGGGHGGGLSATHLGSAHGGAGDSAHGVIGTGHTGGMLGQHARQYSLYATPFATTSPGANHGSHSATEGWAGIHNRLIETDGSLVSGASQPITWPGRPALPSEAPIFAGGLPGLHSASHGGNYGYRQVPLMDQHLGHIAWPDRRDPALGTMSPNGGAVRAPESIPIVRALDTGRKTDSQLVRENILRRAYRLPLVPLRSLPTLGDLGRTLPRPAAARPASPASTDRCGSDASLKALLRRESDRRPSQVDDGIVIAEQPTEDSRATQRPPTTSAAAADRSRAAGGVTHH